MVIIKLDYIIIIIIITLQQTLWITAVDTPRLSLAAVGRTASSRQPHTTATR
jgi:hypothetical protein